MSNYKYYLTGRLGTREVYPVNLKSLEQSWDEEQTRSDYKSSLAGKFVFGGLDYNWLFILEQTTYRCEPLEFKIRKLCEGSYRDFVTTTVSLNSGDWDKTRCTVELEAQELEKYQCYEDGKKTEYNLFTFIPERFAVNALSGEIVEHEVSVTQPDTDPFDPFPGETDPAAKGWVKLIYSIEEAPGSNAEYYVKWVREKYTGLFPPAGGWIQEGTDYYRAPVLYNPVYVEFTPGVPHFYSLTYTIFEESIDNGLALRSIMEFLWGNVCPGLTIQSDFFQWNPINPSPINYATGQASKVLDLIFFQKSDIKRAGATGNATIFNTDLETFLEDLCNTYNLEWEISDDGKFIIEHVSHQVDAVPIDATASEFNAGKAKYVYDKEKLPNRENFRFMENGQGDFSIGTIIYTGCGGLGANEEETYTVKKFTTDVVLCLNNPASDSAIVSDEGFVPIATDGSGGIISEPSIMGGNYLNNSLAWAQLQRDYWRYERPQRKFIMNGSQTTALTVKPTKMEDKIIVRMGCGHVFEPKGKIKTFLGDNGRVKSARYNFYTELLELTVLHSAEEGLLENTGPVAVNDQFETAEDTPVLMDVLANDTDTGGTINPATLEIVLQPNNGTAVVTAGKILYTPNPGFTGDDVLVYLVKDDYNEPSNNAVVTITVS